MDHQQVTVGMQRILRFDYNSGPVNLWSSTYEVTISGESEAIDETLVQDVQLVDVQLINTRPGGSVPNGDAAVYEAELIAPTGWVNFTTVMTGDVSKGVVPLGTQISYGGAMAHFQPSWAVREAAGDQIIMHYEQVRNTDFVATAVKVYLIYTVALGIEHEELADLSVTIGATEIPLPDLIVEKAAEPAILTVDEDSLFFYPNNVLFGKGEAEVQMVVDVPTTAAQTDMKFTSVLDEDQNYPFRFCGVKIHDVGGQRPCLLMDEITSQAVVSKTSDVSLHDDAVSMTIPRLCPYETASSSPSSSQFRQAITLSYFSVIL